MYMVTITTGITTTVHEYVDRRTAEAIYQSAKRRGTATLERIEMPGVGRTMKRDARLERYYANELQKWRDAVIARDQKAVERCEKSLIKLQKQALACGCYETLTAQRRSIK